MLRNTPKQGQQICKQFVYRYSTHRYSVKMSYPNK